MPTTGWSSSRTGGIDTIFASISRGVDANVENLTMLGNQASWAIGNELANVIRGNELTNAIIGGDGDDWIYGGAGDDRITSGPGADHLVGESGFDSFVFTEAFGRDTVHAFERGSDRLILSGLDADTSALGNQAFAFLGGAAFSGTAGELRYDGSSVTGDVNGDGAADFTIVIANNVALTALDLVL